MESYKKLYIELVIAIVLGIIGLVTLGWGLGYRYCLKNGNGTVTNEEYQKTVDSLEQVIKQRELEYNNLLVFRDSLEEKVQDINEKLTALEKNYGQKVISITTFTSPELERFFSDRYGK